MRLKHISTLTVILMFFVISLYILNAQDKPRDGYNLILISVDTLQANSMGIYGYAKNTTPNIDKWAKGATVFTSAYTIYPETFQSFHTLFTGREDVLVNSYPKAQTSDPTFANILKQNNFATAAFVTNPVDGKLFTFFKEGFDEFSYINESKSDQDSVHYKYDYQNAMELTSQAKDWLKNNNEKRFFLWLHYNTPHMPYNPPKEYICKVDENCDISQYEQLLKEELPYSSVLKSCTPNTPKETIELSKNLYDAEIISADDQIGNFLKQVEDLNLLDKTVVVFYSDHGEGFDHDIFGHTGALYESALKIAFIVKHPDASPSFQSEPITNTDMYGTLLDLLNIPNKEPRSASISQISKILPNKKGEPDQKRQFVYARTPQDNTNKFSIFDGTQKYILSDSEKCLTDGAHEELFNLKSDPQETKNLISEEPQKAAELKAQLITYLEQVRNSNPQDANNNSTQLQEETIEELKNLGY